jgi:hypothetical protein
MKRNVTAVFLLLIFATLAPFGPTTNASQLGGLSDARIGQGLKEALNVATGNAVSRTGRLDGYFRNQAIKILMPKKLKYLETGLRAVGYGPKIDEFVLGMNRAAEKAAPKAKNIFLDAIRGMTFNDVRRILTGGDTAATEFFKEKTSASLAREFRPIVEKSMSEVGATKQFRELVDRYQTIPFANKQRFDIDGYVVDGALFGLFYVMGEEEKKIRKNPAARVTSILRDVFGRKF